LLFAAAFLAQLPIGGITGVIMAIFPVDWQLHDTYFVVAHFHYVLFGGSAFGLMAGLYYWFPKLTGRMFSEALGKLSFWTMFVGFNLTFLIQHSAGLSAMPRRVYDYPEGTGLEGCNLASTIGAFILGIGVVDGCAQPAMERQARPQGRQRPLEGKHARVVHPVAAAAEQLRRHPASPQRRADEGHPPRGGSRELARRHGRTAARPPEPLAAHQLRGQRGTHRAEWGIRPGLPPLRTIVWVPPSSRIGTQADTRRGDFSGRYGVPAT